MFLLQVIIEFYILFHNIVQIQTLVQLPMIDNNNIAIAETVIRNTVNDLFTAFKIADIKKRTRIKQFSTIHNFFVSITLTDYDNLNKIARLSTVNNIDNGTLHFIAQINEVLNEGDNNTVTYEDENNIHVETYIEKFINKLKQLKDTYVSYTNTVIKSDILKYLVNDMNTLKNVTIDHNNITSSVTNQQSQDEENVVNDDVWHAESRRLYKGIRTTVKRYPFMASIHFFKKFQCAGSIIKNDLVITSSSCLQIAWNNRFFRENPAFLSVRVGCDYYDFCGDSISILEIYFHPQYEPRTLKHNLAIIRLKRKLHFRFSHGRVKKIDIDKNSWALPGNSRITVVGWGAKDATNLVNDVFRNKLSYAELDFFPLEDCQNYYSKEYVNHYNFCAGFYSKGGGACSHDAGGPGLYNSVLMGVISYGSPVCGAPNVPTVFTKLGYYADWIEDIIEKETLSGYVGSTVTEPRRLPTLAVKSTTKKLKIAPLGDTTASPDYIIETNALRIPQEQAFQDFLSNIFESDEVKAYYDMSDTDNRIELSKGQSSNLKAEQMTLKDVYLTGEIKQTTGIADEPIHTSLEAIDSLENPKVKDEVEEQSIESTTVSLILTSAKVTDSLKGLVTKNKTEEMIFETIAESRQKDNTSTKVGNDDKILEESINSFINNLDLSKFMAGETTLPGISPTSATKQEIELSKTLNETQITFSQRSILNSLFFSDENTDDSDDEKGLSIL